MTATAAVRQTAATGSDTFTGQEVGMVASAAAAQYKDAERAVVAFMTERDELRGFLDAYRTLT
jgi:hypothetical protein